MDFEAVERILGSCLVEADDTEDGVGHKRERRRLFQGDLLRLAGREQPTAEQAYAVGKTPFLIGYVAYCGRVGRWADARRDAEQLRAALAEAAG